MHCLRKKTRSKAMLRDGFFYDPACQISKHDDDDDDGDCFERQCET